MSPPRPRPSPPAIRPERARRHQRTAMSATGAGGRSARPRGARGPHAGGHAGTRPGRCDRGGGRRRAAPLPQRFLRIRLGRAAHGADDHPRGYFRQPVWKRVVVIAAGPAMNVLIAFADPLGHLRPLARRHRSATASRWARSRPTGRRRAYCTRVTSCWPSTAYRFRATAKTSTSSADQRPPLPRQAHRRLCAATPVTLSILRDGHRVAIAVRPTYNAKLGRMVVGFESEPIYRRDSVAAAAGASLSEMGHVTSVTISRVGQIFTSEKARSQLHGIVGVSDVVSQEFSYSATAALFVLALLSLSLAIVNLFPFLPLDGGHIFWALAEKVRGRAIPFAVMERASMWASCSSAFLFFIGLTNDVHSLSNGSLTFTASPLREPYNQADGFERPDSRRAGTDRRRSAGRRADHDQDRDGQRGRHHGPDRERRRGRRGHRARGGSARTGRHRPERDRRALAHPGDRRHPLQPHAGAEGHRGRRPLRAVEPRQHRWAGQGGRGGGRRQAPGDAAASGRQLRLAPEAPAPARVRRSRRGAGARRRGDGRVDGGARLHRLQGLDEVDLGARTRSPPTGCCPSASPTRCTSASPRPARSGRAH